MHYWSMDLHCSHVRSTGYWIYWKMHLAFSDVYIDQFCIFFTLLSAAEPVYMMRAIPDKAQKEFTATLTGLIGVIAAAVGYMIFPCYDGFSWQDPERMDSDCFSYCGPNDFYRSHSFCFHQRSSSMYGQ